MSNVKCQMSKGGENSQISYAEKSSLILDLMLAYFWALPPDLNKILYDLTSSS